MALSNQLLSEFAKITNDKSKEQENTTAYGEVVRVGSDSFVRIDGSELLTPFERTVTVKQGDRVRLKVENHSVTVTGNLSDPSYSSSDGESNHGKIEEFDIIISHKITTDEIYAITGYFEQIQAIIANIEELHAVYAEIEELKATYATIDHLNAEDMKVINAEIEKIKSEIIESSHISADDLDAVRAYFNNVQAYNADFVYVSAEVIKALKAELEELDVEHLNARYAQIDFANIGQAAINKLKANFADIDLANITVAAIDNLTAKMVNIDFATINQATIDSLKAKYAEIDFSNIGMAAIEKLFTDSGIIKDLIVEQGKITGELVGVTIKGDLIEGNTIKADKLVVLGEDGIYYKLNIDGLDHISTTEAAKFVLLTEEPDDWEENYKDYYQIVNNEYIHLTDTEAPIFQTNTFYKLSSTYQNGLDGTNIIAQSVTADKIRVSDLVAFGATIGGFDIDTHSIHSHLKTSATSNAQGLYLNDSGEMAVGDANRFMKYFYDQATNTYKLEIKADSIRFDSGTKDLKQTINDMKSDIQDAQSALSLTIKSIQTQYARNQDNTTAPTSGWSTDTPRWQQGYYIWAKNIVTFNDDTTREDNPVCITGNTGPQGNPGQSGDDGLGIKSIVEQYYLSTSNTTRSGGSWSTNMPQWEENKFIWMRMKIEWTYDGTTIYQTTYTDPFLAEALNTSHEEINNINNKINKWIQSVDVYYNTSDGLIAPVEGWVTNYPSGMRGKNLWIKNIVNYSDGTYSEMLPRCVDQFSSPTIPSVTLITQSEFPYNFQKSGDWYINTNQNQNSSTCQSTFRIYSSTGYAKLKIIYEQDSELYCDYLTIDGVSTAGKSSGEVYVSLSSGNNDIIIKYTKDGSVHTGTDTGRVRFEIAQKGLNNFYNQYYLSDSGASITGGSWVNYVPTINDKTKYLWKRERMEWDTNAITYSDAYLINSCYINVSETLKEIERSLNTTFGTTANGWEMAFNILTQNFNNLNRYIRFENGNIVLGEEGNAVTLKIENDIIGFYQWGQRVAYLSDGELQVTNAKIMTQLNLGNFAFVPGKSGNLTFKKVVN